jgi:hypothetical protein
MSTARLAAPALGAIGLLLLVPAGGCFDARTYPGHLAATFRIDAVAPEGALWECADAGYVELPPVRYTFTTHFSGSSPGAVDWMTVGDNTRQASFDGQYIESLHDSTRQFTNCGGATAAIVEPFKVALLSLSQNTALGGECPENPLDPASFPPDASRPGPLPTGGFDALKACGELTDNVIPEPGAPCPPCSITFHLTGVRL